MNCLLLEGVEWSDLPNREQWTNLWIQLWPLDPRTFSWWANEVSLFNPTLRSVNVISQSIYTGQTDWAKVQTTQTGELSQAVHRLGRAARFIAHFTYISLRHDNFIYICASVLKDETYWCGCCELHLNKQSWQGYWLKYVDVIWCL